MKKIFNKASNALINQLGNEIKELTNFKLNSNWSVLKPMTSTHKGSCCIGIYKIVYNPSGRVMSIGQGNVSARKARHLGVFRNKGQTLVSENGKPSPSITGQKMYEHDANEDNWFFSFIDVGNKKLASLVEGLLIEDEEPLFNNVSMGGNN